MHRYFIFFLLWMMAACSPAHKASRTYKKNKDNGLPVVRKLKQLDSTEEGYMRARGGSLFRITNADRDGEGLEDAEESLADGDCKSGEKNCTSPFFLGSDRKAAKMTYSKKAMPRKPEPLQHLLDRLHNSEKFMMNHEPAITTGCLSARVAEEMENVWIEHVFVYVILREDDGDYHLIVGDGKQTAPETLFGIEISGLPETSSPFYAKMKQVRDKFEKRFQTCGRKNLWEKKETLLEISVKGSLFFDMFHAVRHKHSGDKSIKTDTFWEIHPVTDIKFWN